MRSQIVSMGLCLLYLTILLSIGCDSGTNAVPEEADHPGVLAQSPTPFLPTTRVGETSVPTATTDIATYAPESTSAIEIEPATVTSEPLSTLTPDEKTRLLFEILQPSSTCRLPCWWGIVPGETSLAAVKDNLAQKGFRVGSNSVGMRGRDNFGVFLEFEMENDTIEVIRATGDYLTGAEDSEEYSRTFAAGWYSYGLSNMLDRYGAPTQVFVYSPFQADLSDGPAYHLLVFYENLGIVIEYVGNAKHLGDQRYQACPTLREIWNIKLLLYQPDHLSNVLEKVLPRESIAYIDDPETVYERISWQAATGANLQFFYDTFRSAESGVCFEFSTS